MCHSNGHTRVNPSQPGQRVGTACVRETVSKGTDAPYSSAKCQLISPVVNPSAYRTVDSVREHKVQPWRVEAFKFSTDPELVGEVTEVVGHYLAVPEHAIVLCVDERSQIQALGRTAAMLPMLPGLPERRTRDYNRRGTSTLFAALEIGTAKVTTSCNPRHLHQELPAFLKQVARAYPDTGDGASCAW